MVLWQEEAANGGLHSGLLGPKSSWSEVTRVTSAARAHLHKAAFTVCASSVLEHLQYVLYIQLD